MKDNNFKNLTTEELEEKLEGLKKNLMEMNFQKKIASVDKPHRFKEVRRDIARVLTAMRTFYKKKQG